MIRKKQECNKCKSISEWIDDRGITPNKLDRYERLLEFVKQLADESVYERYENLNEMNWAAFELLQEIGEIK